MKTPSSGESGAQDYSEGSRAMLDARRREIVELRESGKNFREIGEIFCIPRNHAHALYASAIKHMLRLDDAFGPLSIRARNCLAAEGLQTKEEIVESIKSGRLHPHRVPFYGRRTHTEVLRWAGFNESMSRMSVAELQRNYNASKEGNS
jgi:hypothetical protein